MKTTHLAARFAASIQRALITIAGLGMFLVMLVAPACSSSSTCDDSKCSANNKCIDDGAHGTACRLVCDSQTACPFNFHCTTAKTTKLAFCVADTNKFAKLDKGQWGAHCNSSGGLDSNPDCASDQNFWCYGQTPTDAAAYCTQYQCATDKDCAGGFWCATINDAPDVRNSARTFGADKVTTVCKKREYCATCVADVDCPSVAGVKSHCVASTGDGVSLCTTECANDGNCNPDATCTDGAGTTVCMPRAGTCKGDGTLCAPCRSDVDCPKGYCIYDAYSHERYCSVASKTPCSVSSSMKLIADCPSLPPNGPGISCETLTNNESIPKDQCIGLIKDSQGGTAEGCWAVNKK